MEINFYLDLSHNRDKLVYERINKCFFDSETLWEELVWCKDLAGKGDEGGVFAPLQMETLIDIFNENSGDLELEMDKDEYQDLIRVTKAPYEIIMCKIDN